MCRPVLLRLYTQVTYVGADNAIYSKAADGSGEAEILAPSEYPNTRLGSWSPDGEVLMFHAMLNPVFQLFTLRTGGTIERFRTTPFSESRPELSPDGRWILYLSDESGQWEVYLQPYPGPGERVQVSLAGGRQPSWSRDGHEIFYRAGGDLMVVLFDAFDERTEPPVGRPHTLIAGGGQMSNSSFYRYYDAAPDAQSFVMVASAPSERRREIRVVLNWLEELTERLPTE